MELATVMHVLSKHTFEGGGGGEGGGHGTGVTFPGGGDGVVDGRSSLLRSPKHTPASRLK